MTSADPDPHPAPSSAPQVAQPRRTAHVSFWVRELPFTLVLVLTIFGVAYTSFSKQPIIGYWEILAPIIGLVCVATGWDSAIDKAARLRLIGTQVMHWLAFLVVMNLMLLPSVRFHCKRYGACDFHLTDAWHVYRWRACPFLANLSSRADYGVWHSGNSVDRKLGSDFRADCGRPAGNCRGILVALAGQACAVKKLNGEPADGPHFDRPHN